MATRIDSFSRPIPPPDPAGPLPASSAPQPDPRPSAAHGPSIERISADPALLRFVHDTHEAERSGKPAQLSGIARSSESIDQERTAKLRDFFAAYTVRVAGPSGPIDVVTPFGMNHGGREVERNAKALREALGGDVRGIQVGLLCSGRPSPEDVRRVATKLAALHPDKATDPATFREYLRDCGVGIDCAGIVQQALYASRDRKVSFDRGELGLRPRLDEDLSNLAGRGWRKIEGPADARPGDVIALAPPPGDKWPHRVIVVEKRVEPATGQQADRFARAGLEVAPGDRLVELRVASSWGGREVAERSFFYDTRSGRWADDARMGGTLASSRYDGPYDHPLEGIYRAP